MKKLFTLVAVALMAVSANAQESWYVNNEDGTLKDVYVANSDPSAMSVVEFSTDNVTGTHTSGPIAGYEDGDTLPLEQDVDNTWGGIQIKDLSSDGSVPPFYYVCGKGNPVNIDLVTFEEIVTDDEPTGTYRAYWDDSYYLPDGSAGLPSNGTYITLTPKVNGTMTVALWINKGNREVYIAKASDCKALSLATYVTASGYVNGTNWSVEEGEITEDSPLNGYPKNQESIEINADNEYVVGVGNQAIWGYLTFSVDANETYYIFHKNSQIGFSGYSFDAGSTGIAELTTNVEDVNAPIYNLAGQRVTKATKGILIQNGKKFINK